MNIKKTVNIVDKASKFLKLSRKDLIWVITILLLVAGWFVYEKIKKEYQNKVTETKIVYKNDKFLRDSIPIIFNNGFSNLENTFKKGINIVRIENKREIKDSEKRINKHTNKKISTILKFIPSISDKNVEIIKEIIEIKDEENEEVIIDEIDVEILDNFYTEKYKTVEFKSEYNWMDNIYDSIIDNAIKYNNFTDSLTIEKKQGFFKKLFNKN